MCGLNTCDSVIWVKRPPLPGEGSAGRSTVVSTVVESRCEIIRREMHWATLCSGTWLAWTGRADIPSGSGRRREGIEDGTLEVTEAHCNAAKNRAPVHC